MKQRIPALFLLALATLAGAWLLLRAPESSELAPPPVARSAAESRSASMVAPSTLGASSVLSIDPRAKPVKGASPAKAQRVTLQGEFLRAKNYMALYDRLRNGPEGQTPEGWYVMYEMLRRCANVTDRTTRAPAPPSTQKRDDFIAAIPDSDPMRDKRIAAFDDVSVNRCAGMEGITIAQADLDKMLASAAAGGSAAGQALTLEQQLWAERRAAATTTGQWGRNTSVTLSDAQVANVQALAGSRDPEAMIIAGRILSTPWNNFALGAGTDGTPVEPRALTQAFQLLACDYGYPCDESNPRVLAGCAYQGHCNATSLADYIYYYGASPNDSQLMSQYQDLLRNAIQTGNWSQLPVVRAPRVVPPPMNGFAPGGG